MRVVPEGHDVAREDAQDEAGLWQRLLAQVAFRLNERHGAVVHDAGDQTPDDERGGQVGEVLGDRLPEDGRVDDTDCRDEDRYAQRDPELAQTGAAVALPDVADPEEPPQAPALQALLDVEPSPC